VVPWLAFAMLAAACSESSSGPEQNQRWARSFVPFEKTWRPLDQVPSEPQETPQMVIWEVSHFSPDTQPTVEQQSAAQQLIDRAEQVVRARGWYDFQQGLADGYKLLFADRRHYATCGRTRAVSCAAC
jgi:hypothetical protein